MWPWDAASGASPDVWDNGEVHLRIEFDRKGDAMVARGIDCISKVLNAKEFADPIIVV